MEQPAHVLGHLGLVDGSVDVPLLDKVSDSLDGCVLDDVSVLSVEDFAGKQTPKNLEDELVRSRLVAQDFLQREQYFFGF